MAKKQDPTAYMNMLKTQDTPSPTPIVPKQFLRAHHEIPDTHTFLFGRVAYEQSQQWWLVIDIECVCQVVEDVLEAMHADGSEAMPVPPSAYSSGTSRPSKIPLRELLQSFYDLR